MKSNHWYHAFSGIVFISIGVYFLNYPPETISNAASSGIQKALPWVIILWGSFKCVNAFLLFKKKQKAQ